MVRLLGPAADEGVTPTEELAAILLSKLALEPESHAQIARSGAISVSLQPTCAGTWHVSYILHAIGTAVMYIVADLQELRLLQQVCRAVDTALQAQSKPQKTSSDIS